MRPDSWKFFDQQDNILPPIALKTAEFDQFANAIHNEAPFY
jgi:hypothetical protein